MLQLSRRARAGVWALIRLRSGSKFANAAAAPVWCPPNRQRVKRTAGKATLDTKLLERQVFREPTQISWRCGIRKCAGARSVRKFANSNLAKFEGSQSMATGLPPTVETPDTRLQALPPHLRRVAYRGSGRPTPPTFCSRNLAGFSGSSQLKLGSFHTGYPAGDVMRPAIGPFCGHRRGLGRRGHNRRQSRHTPPADISVIASCPASRSWHRFTT